MSDLDEFMKDPWKKVNEWRKTPHACDYIYSIDPSGTMFFEICKYCFDTNGVVEMNNEWDIRQSLSMELDLGMTGIDEIKKKSHAYLAKTQKDPIGKIKESSAMIGLIL
jgi:hypothetical protein